MVMSNSNRKRKRVDSSTGQTDGTTGDIIQSPAAVVLTMLPTMKTLDFSDLDDRKRRKMDSSGQGTTPSDHVPTHPAVLGVFRTDSILEEICSHLEFKDLKQFRLVSRTCNSERRRALIKREGHWVVVKSKDDGWQLELGQVLTNLEETASAGGANYGSKLLGWIFKRLELVDWRDALDKPLFFRQWGHYLRKIHLKTDDVFGTFSVSRIINLIYNLLYVCCPNLDEMVLVLGHPNDVDSSLELLQPLDDLEFPSPLLKLKCFRLTYLSVGFIDSQNMMERFCTFFARLITAAGSALEKLEIDYGDDRDPGDREEDDEENMVDSISKNMEISTFQSLQEMTLQFAHHFENLSRTIHICFPILTKLILGNFNSDDRMRLNDPRYQIFTEYFPALMSLTILCIHYNDVTTGKILYFLQHFPNLEALTVSLSYEEDWTEILDPIAPRSKCLRSLTVKTDNNHLHLLRCVIILFPNIVTLNLLEFGREHFGISEHAEYSFGELIDTLSPLGCLKGLYVHHAFHTPLQLVDAIQLTSNFAAFERLILLQTAHDYAQQRFNVSLYLTSSDPDFQYLLYSDCVKRLKSVRLLNFRFGTTQKEMEEHVAAKGGHVLFRTISLDN